MFDVFFECFWLKINSSLFKRKVYFGLLLKNYGRKKEEKRKGKQRWVFGCYLLNEYNLKFMFF